MQINREFNHRGGKTKEAFGHIGKVVLESDVTTIKLNGKPIPEKSIEYLLNFSLQSLQDAYAGAANRDEALGEWGKKLDSLIDGTIGVRGEAANVTDEVRIARQIVQAKYKAKVSKEAYKAWLTNDEDEKAAFLDGLVEKNAAAITPLVVEELKRIAAKKQAMASVSFEL